jgi:YD repeat-containing protein
MRLVTGPDEFGSVYVYFGPKRKGSVALTVTAAGEVNLDYDKAGKLIGIELLDIPYRTSGDMDR